MRLHLQALSEKYVCCLAQYGTCDQLPWLNVSLLYFPIGGDSIEEPTDLVSSSSLPHTLLSL